MRRRRRWYRSLVLLGGILALMALPASAGATLARTPVPYMGWNSYYQVGSETPGSNNINESTIKSVAQSLVSSGLAKAGYNIVWLDFGWASGARDGNGNLVVDTTQWPDGLPALTTYLHGLGLQAGIYTDAGSTGCSGQGVGSYGHYQQDADQFALWGFDVVKVDFCGAGQEWLDQPPNDPRTLYAQFSNAVANTGRPMILNVCNPWTPGRFSGSAPSFVDSSWDTYSWAPADGQSWRTDTDIGFPRKPNGTGGIQFVNVLRNLAHDTGTSSNASQPGIQTAAGPPGTPVSSAIAWGHWNDPDYLGPGLGMTDTQARSQLSMWAMVAAPLILGSDPRLLSTRNLNMLENPRVIAIDQDPLGVQGYLLTASGSAQVWVKPLADGARAVALLNTGSSSQPIATSARGAGMPPAGRYTLLNLWTNQTSTTTGKITALVPPNAAVLYRVTASRHTITVARRGTGSGTVRSSPAGIDCGSSCTASYPPGTAVVLSATPSLGATFAGWSGGCTGTRSCTVTTSAAQTVIATFTLSAPNTEITSAKVSNSTRTATFTFKAMGASTGLRCALVKQPKRQRNTPRPSYTSCRSPKSYTRLKPGRYTFLVRAFNAGGSDPTPATRRFTIH